MSRRRKYKKRLSFTQSVYATYGPKQRKKKAWSFYLLPVVGKAALVWLFEKIWKGAIK
jgi:hypothetical protein